MTKHRKLYLRIHPESQNALDKLLDESLDKVSQIENVKKVEGQVGYLGEEKKRSKDDAVE